MRLSERLMAALGRGNAQEPAAKSETAKPIVLSRVHQMAAQGLTNWPLVHSREYQSQIVKTPRDAMHPRMVEFGKKFQKECAKRGIPMFVFEYWRSPERQRVLKKQGASRAGPWRSPHQWGMAVDLIHSSDFWELSDAEWAVIGAIGKEVARRMKLDVEWGGDWGADWPNGKRGWDPAHWQLKQWKKLSRAGHEEASFPHPDHFGRDVHTQWFAAAELAAGFKV